MAFQAQTGGWLQIQMISCMRVLDFSLYLLIMIKKEKQNFVSTIWLVELTLRWSFVLFELLYYKKKLNLKIDSHSCHPYRMWPKPFTYFSNWYQNTATVKQIHYFINNTWIVQYSHHKCHENLNLSIFALQCEISLSLWLSFFFLFCLFLHKLELHRLEVSEVVLYNAKV